MKHESTRAYHEARTERIYRKQVRKLNAILAAQITAVVIGYLAISAVLLKILFTMV